MLSTGLEAPQLHHYGPRHVLPRPEMEPGRGSDPDSRTLQGHWRSKVLNQKDRMDLTRDAPLTLCEWHQHSHPLETARDQRCPRLCTCSALLHSADISAKGQRAKLVDSAGHTVNVTATQLPLRQGCSCGQHESHGPGCSPLGLYMWAHMGTDT